MVMYNSTIRGNGIKGTQELSTLCFCYFSVNLKLFQYKRLIVKKNTRGYQSSVSQLFPAVKMWKVNTCTWPTSPTTTYYKESRLQSCSLFSLFQPFLCFTIWNYLFVHLFTNFVSVSPSRTSVFWEQGPVITSPHLYISASLQGTRYAACSNKISG